MNKFLFSLLLFCSTSSLLMASTDPETKNNLIAKAQEAQQKAYAPYSKYNVGAALMTQEGEIILGCNVENASYGLCNCAERSAIFSAISQGKKNFTAIAVVTKDGGSPCGACRQVLNEFNPQMNVIIANQKGDLIKETTVEMLLPNAFGPRNLD